MDSLTSAIADTATALSAQQLKGEMNVRLLDKALDAQAQQALSLLAALPASPSAAGVGEVIDVIA